MRFVLALLLLLTASPALAQVPLTQREMIGEVIHNYIRPNFHAFNQAGETLQARAEALCAAPSPEALEASREAFRDFLLAYARVEFVTAGPLGVGDRVLRLLLWPDPKGIVLKQIQTTIAKKDETATDPKTLYDKSVGLQGLMALEFVLFGTGADDLASAKGDYRCRYGLAVTSLISGLAKTIDAEWQEEGEAGAAGQMTDPKPDAENYRTLTEVMEKLAATLVHGTDAIRDTRLTPVLGAEGDKPRPKAGIFWRSNMTMPMLAAEFASLSDFFDGARLRDGLQIKDDWIADGAEYEFDNAAKTLASLDDDTWEEIVASESGREALGHLIIVTGSLDKILGDNLARAFGLAIGFSALDKD
jgi:predicted lipoprotein